MFDRLFYVGFGVLSVTAVSEAAVVVSNQLVVSSTLNDVAVDGVTTLDLDQELQNNSVSENPSEGAASQSISATANVQDGAAGFDVVHNHEFTAPQFGTSVTSVNSEVIQKLIIFAEPGDQLKIQTVDVNNSWNSFGLTGTQTTEVSLKDAEGNFVMSQSGLKNSSVLDDTAQGRPGGQSGAYEETFVLEAGEYYTFLFRSAMDLENPGGVHGGTNAAQGTVNLSLANGNVFSYDLRAIPEPGSFAMVVVGMAGLMFRRQRSKTV